MGKLVSDRTAARIMSMLNRHDATAARVNGGGAQRWVFVRCDSATAVGGDDVRDQCYPATVLRPAVDAALPPEEGEYEVLLTVIGADGESVAPTEGSVYVALAASDVVTDASGSGSGSVSGRPRVFSAFFGDVVGPNGGSAGEEFALFDGTSGKLLKASEFKQGSLGGGDYTIEHGTGSRKFYATKHTVSVSELNTDAVTTNKATLTAGGVNDLPYVILEHKGKNVWLMNNQGKALIVVPNGDGLVLGGEDSGTPATYNTTVYKISRYEGGTTVTRSGVNGELGDGSRVDGGIITEIGGDTFLTQATADTLYQPLDTDLTSIAANTSTGVLLYRHAAGDWRTVTVGTNLTFNATTGTLSASSSSDGDKGDVVVSSSGTVWEVESAAKAFAFKGVIYVNQATDANNWNPTGIADAVFVNITNTNTATITLTGITGGANGRVIMLRNYNSTYDVVLAANSVSSTAANRFDIPSDITLQPGESVLLTNGSFGVTTAGWACIGRYAKPSTSLLGVSLGGTGANLSATGGTGQYLKQTSVGGAVTVAAITASDLPTFGAAGGSAAKGAVPAPGSTAHSNRPYILGDNGSWTKWKGELIGSKSFDFDGSTLDTTTSTTLVELATTHRITFTLDETSDVVVFVGATVRNSGAGNDVRIGIDVDGTSTIVSRTRCLTANVGFPCANEIRVTGLTSGSHTIQFRASTSANTATIFAITIEARRAES